MLRNSFRSFALATAITGLVVLSAIVSSCARVDISDGQQDEQLPKLLKAKMYDELDARLDKLMKEYERDYTREQAVDVAFDTFRRAGPELEVLLSEWIAKRPDSHIAYLARGVYYTRVAGARRGDETSSNTSAQQMAVMAQYLQKAETDLDKALLLNGRLVHALAYKMEIPTALGGRPHEIQALRDRALKLNPYSLTARWYYIMSRLPRWGGSVSEVVAEVEAARPYYMANPALKVLEGRVDAEYGDEAFFAGRYARAIELYTQALQHGPQWYYYVQRSQAYTYVGQIDLANQDLRRVLLLRPNRSKTLYDLGFIHYRAAFQLQDKKYLTEAVNFLNQALEDNSYDHKAFDIRGDAYFFLEKFELALADFERALVLAPDNAEYREDVAKAKRALSSSRKSPKP